MALKHQWPVYEWISLTWKKQCAKYSTIFMQNSPSHQFPVHYQNVYGRNSSIFMTRCIQKCIELKMWSHSLVLGSHFHCRWSRRCYRAQFRKIPHFLGFTATPWKTRRWCIDRIQTVDVHLPTQEGACFARRRITCIYCAWCVIGLWSENVDEGYTERVGRMLHRSKFIPYPRRRIHRPSPDAKYFSALSHHCKTLWGHGLNIQCIMNDTQTTGLI